jgi:hypothetical protein
VSSSVSQFGKGAQVQNLQKISIAFTTYSHSFETAPPPKQARPAPPTAYEHPLVHVFVRNRRSDTSLSDSNLDFVANYLAWNDIEAKPPVGINQYLGAALGLDGLFPAKSVSPNPDNLPLTQEFEIPLRRQPILPGEVLLPVVDVHLYSVYYGTWSFNYTLTLHFNDGSISYSPSEEGIRSILLDSSHANYSGICREANTLSGPAQPGAEPVYLASVTLDFGTHDDAKAVDTQLNVHIVNRLSATSNQDIVIAENLFSNQAFPLPTATGPHTNLRNFPGDRTVIFGRGSLLPLASQEIQLQEIVLPIVYIIIAPTGDDRWIFDYRVTYTFANGMRFSSTTTNVSLDANSNKHAGVYTGPPFPTYAPPPVQNTFWPATVRSLDKHISASFVNDKLSELVNDRADPLFMFRVDSIRDFGGQQETYYDLQTIMPDPPTPGTPSVPGFMEGVTYRSSPSSVGFLPHYAYFKDEVESESFTITIDSPSGPLPITALLTFKTPFDVFYTALTDRTMTVEHFSVQLRFTLTRDPDNQKVDLLRWVHDLNNIRWSGGSYTGEFLGKPLDGTTVLDPDDFVDSLVQEALDVTLTTTGGWDSGGAFQKQMRRKIFSMLSTPATITEKSLADRINDYVNAWLLGGVVSGEGRCTVTDVHLDDDGDTFHIVYTGPSYDPPRPATWPSGDFTPGALANIDHIIVLTKENRSFDSMLGYLSLPLAADGQGRTDIDGLRGGEFNTFNGATCPSFAFEPQDTIFSPNPPQDPQRTLKETDNGKMDGFVAAFADQDGVVVAPRIMGYHNAANVPQFDALSRDFAICHRWFAPHPGPTFPNRFYELTGRLNRTPDGLPITDNTIPIQALDFASPVMPALTQTIFDYLPSTVTWRYFENGGYCFLRLFADHTFDNTNIVSFDDPHAGFLALAKRGELPNVSFIDPHFIDIPPGANCDEPPADVRPGQDLVKQIVEAVVSSPQWDRTLLIITYDEHGGFFDHVRPPAAAKVTPESVETYGVRVPAFVISPWVKPGSVFGYDGPFAPHGLPEPGTKPVVAAATNPGATPASPGPPAEPAHAAPIARADSHMSAAVSVAGHGADRAKASSAHAVVASKVLQLNQLHFDHTSILKTIARRFISSAPPYLGARFAAASDLSSIFTTAPRSSEFRPFIPYALVYAQTHGALEVPNDSVIPGTALRQNTPDPTAESQAFRFEDAGDGSWYLRTRTGYLYLTADVGMNLTQQPKLTGASAAGSPDSQRWNFTKAATPGSDFTISNAAHPNKTLQPVGGSATMGAAVVLGDPEGGTGIASRVKNAWQITSALLPAPSRAVAHV